MLTDAKEAIRENLIQVHKQLSSIGPDDTPQVSFIQTETCIRQEADFRFGMCNRVFSYSISGGIDPVADMKSIADTYLDRGMKCHWLTYSHDQVKAIDEALAKNHFEPIGSMSGMALSLEDWVFDPSPIPGLEIRIIHSAEEIEMFKRVLVTGFEFPEQIADEASRVFVDKLIEKEAFQYYLAFINGEPVCTLTTFCEGEVAGIYSVTTLENYRSKGIGGAIVAHALRDVQTTGAKLAILQASSMGARVYSRLGFKEEMTIHVYSR